MAAFQSTAFSTSAFSTSAFDFGDVAAAAPEGLFGDDTKRSYIPGYWDGMDKIRENEKKLAEANKRREENEREQQRLSRKRKERDIALLQAKEIEALQAGIREEIKALQLEKQRLLEAKARDEEDALIALFSMPFVQ